MQFPYCRTFAFMFCEEAQRMEKLHLVMLWVISFLFQLSWLDLFQLSFHQTSAHIYSTEHTADIGPVQWSELQLQFHSFSIVLLESFIGCIYSYTNHRQMPHRSNSNANVLEYMNFVKRNIAAQLTISLLDTAYTVVKIM